MNLFRRKPEPVAPDHVAVQRAVNTRMAAEGLNALDPSAAMAVMRDRIAKGDMTREEVHAFWNDVRVLG